ncbi:hypothetical protein ACFY8W_26350 [Streptomyces sp. NPDC012637]|uniref:hypothetical protein n=1 Tax=Streptomyces sp. NPDC012637 TaxID=3364842 RepID=UPI0036ECF689
MTTEEPDAGLRLKVPRVPHIHHIRLCEKRVGLTTVRSARRRAQATQEHGYEVGRAFFPARRAAMPADGA